TLLVVLGACAGSQELGSRVQRFKGSKVQRFKGSIENGVDRSKPRSNTPRAGGPDAATRDRSAAQEAATSRRPGGGSGHQSAAFEPSSANAAPERADRGRRRRSRRARQSVSAQAGAFRDAAGLAPPGRGGLGGGGRA